MPGDPSAPRRLARPIALAALALFSLATVASLRWAFVLCFAQHQRIGLIGAGLWFQDDSVIVPRTSPFPFPTAPLPAPPPTKHNLIYIYRHAFGFQRWYETGVINGQSWTVPLWPLFAVGAALGAVHYTRRRLARKPWQCKACGYDLRGLSAGPCPECGRRPA